MRFVDQIFRHGIGLNHPHAVCALNAVSSDILRRKRIEVATHLFPVASDDAAPLFVKLIKTPHPGLRGNKRGLSPIPDFHLFSCFGIYRRSVLQRKRLRRPVFRRIMRQAVYVDLFCRGIVGDGRDF